MDAWPAANRIHEPAAKGAVRTGRSRARRSPHPTGPGRGWRSDQSEIHKRNPNRLFLMHQIPTTPMRSAQRTLWSTQWVKGPLCGPSKFPNRVKSFRIGPSPRRCLRIIRIEANISMVANTPIRADSRDS